MATTATNTVRNDTYYSGQTMFAPVGNNPSEPVAHDVAKLIDATQTMFGKPGADAKIGKDVLQNLQTVLGIASDPSLTHDEARRPSTANGQTAPTPTLTSGA